MRTLIFKTRLCFRRLFFPKFQKFPLTIRNIVYSSLCWFLLQVIGRDNLSTHLSREKVASTSSMGKWGREEEERQIVGGSCLTPHLSLKLCWVNLGKSQSRRVIPSFLRHLREDPCPTWATQAEDGIEIGGLVSRSLDPCCGSAAAAKDPSPPRGLGTYPESADYTKSRETERPQDVRDYQRGSQKIQVNQLNLSEHLADTGCSETRPSQPLSSEDQEGRGGQLSLLRPHEYPFHSDVFTTKYYLVWIGLCSPRIHVEFLTP